MPAPLAIAMERLGRLLRADPVDQQELDPAFRVVARAHAVLGTLEALPPARARKKLARSQWPVRTRGPAMEVAPLAGPRPMRIYRPSAGARRGLLYLHGGGWVVGDLDTHDGLCRRLAAGSGRVVVALDYRLAPEHPFPAAVEDTDEAWSFLQEQAGALGVESFAVAGDSAGGNLALGLSQRAARKPERQLLIYPGLDVGAQTPSKEIFAEGHLLTRRLIDWFKDHYLQGADPLDPRVSPARGPLAGLPPTDIVTAGMDPLRDEAEHLVPRLRDCGVDVRLRRFDGLPHGFAQLSGASPAAERAVDELAALLRP